MHPKVLSANAWKTARSLSSEGWLDSWVLAGGTGLALHLGHRYSEDLDLFGDKPFDPAALAQSLSRIGGARVQQSAVDILHVELNGPHAQPYRRRRDSPEAPADADPARRR